MKSKTAQGLSLNVIIIAAVVLIVLVVLVFIFSGRMGAFTTGLKTCKGECRVSCLEGETPIYLPGCQEVGQDYTDNEDYCCVSN